MAEAIVANALRYQGRDLKAQVNAAELGLTQALMVDPAELEAKKEEWAKMKAERDAQEKIREERERRLNVLRLAEAIFLRSVQGVAMTDCEAIDLAGRFYTKAKEFLDKQ